MTDPGTVQPAENRKHLRRHRIARAIIAAVGAVLLLIGVFSAVPATASGGLFLGIFRADTPLLILRLVAGAALLIAAFVPGFTSGRALCIVFGLIFGLIGLIGGLTHGSALGFLTVTDVDNSFNVLLCTVLLGVATISLDRFAEIAV